MRKGASRWVLLPVGSLLTALAVSLLMAGGGFDPAADPHSHFRNPDICPRCHVYYRSELDPDRFVPDVDAFCRDCHKGEKLNRDRSHPVNVRPREKYRGMKIPEIFRLDDDGRLMCLTCHTAHGPFLSTVKAFAGQKPENPGAARGGALYYRTYYVRVSDPVKGYAPLCMGCHPY